MSSMTISSSEKTDLVGALRRHREMLRWENNLLKTEIKSRNLAPIAGKKAYLKRHHSEGDGRPISPQLAEQMSIQNMKGINLVSLPYLVGSHEEAIDLLLHEAHKLGYRIRSMRELGVPVPLEKLRLLSLISDECVRISRTIARHGSPCKSSEDAAVSFLKDRRIAWESTWGSPVLECGGFNDITTLSPMYSTHCAPGIIPYSGFTTTALQIYSFKIYDLDQKLKWPLCVYGVVAARDTVDGNRNLLFSRSRDNCQVLTEKDPFLHLTGPSRAILAECPVDFEVELRKKYETESKDKALISSTNHHHFSANTACFLGCLCSAELSLQTLDRAVQATILSVQVVGGGFPFKYGGQIACSVSASASPRQVVLVESHAEEMHIGPDGYLNLSRNVVSVKCKGSLRIIIKSYTESHLLAHEAQLDFPTQHCQISKKESRLSEHEVVVIIAWSLLVRGQAL